MLILNSHQDYLQPLPPGDAQLLNKDATAEVERFLGYRKNHRPTRLCKLDALARELRVGSIEIKDESTRLGLGSFKALGGSYAVIRLVLERATDVLQRPVDISKIHSEEVHAVAKQMTFGCATDGNHGRSVAAGAELVGAKAAIFVHSGVSDERVEAIARFGAEMIRVAGTYDDSVEEAERVCREKGWTVVSDTSWPGYERIPSLVMQGYTAMLAEAIRDMVDPPTHIFMQAGVGGLAAGVAGYFAELYGSSRPMFIVVEPERAACLFESAKAGRAVKVPAVEPTIMAMLECYEPSLVAWRIISRASDAFMTLTEEDAMAAMRRLAAPLADDPAIVSGESGCAGLAGLLVAACDENMRDLLKLTPQSRIFLISTEGATDRSRYEAIVGRSPDDVLLTSA